MITCAKFGTVYYIRRHEKDTRLPWHIIIYTPSNVRMTFGADKVPITSKARYFYIRIYWLR